MSNLSGLQRLYQLTAPHYERDVASVFSPLVQDFSQWVIRCASARLDYSLNDPFEDELSSVPLRKLPSLTTVDLGTGTGLLARYLAPYVNRVVGVDVSAEMLKSTIAQAQWSPVQADIQRLPFKDSSVSLAVSSFGLNASIPKSVFRSVWQVLKRGEGMFAFQEWGVEDEASQVVDEIVGNYLDEIEGVAEDEVLDSFYQSPKEWYDQLQDADDIYAMLKSLGFRLVWAKEDAFVTARFDSQLPFIHYKLAWPARQAALAVMNSEMRTKLDHDLNQALKPYTNLDGSFDWSPMLFRVFAER
jgi:ubiquinone/menaquinone biosynthesis C-methylase UbiE